MRRFGASPSEVTRMAAEAAIAADLLFNQTGDPMNRLVLVVLPDGTYATETMRNKMMREQNYSQKKTIMEYALFGAVGLGALWLVSKIWR